MEYKFTIFTVNLKFANLIIYFSVYIVTSTIVKLKISILYNGIGQIKKIRDLINLISIIKAWLIVERMWNFSYGFRSPSMIELQSKVLI